MSPDEVFLETLLRAVASARLEALIVGSAAAALQGAPVMTQDVDLLVRDTVANRKKIDALCQNLGVRPVEISPLTSTITLLGPGMPVDVLFDRLPGGLRFASLKSRSRRIPVGTATAVVTDLADVIASKEASARPKDLAYLPILRSALRARQVLEEEAGSPSDGPCDPPNVRRPRARRRK